MTGVEGWHDAAQGRGGFRMKRSIHVSLGVGLVFGAALASVSVPAGAQVVYRHSGPSPSPQPSYLPQHPAGAGTDAGGIVIRSPSPAPVQQIPSASPTPAAAVKTGAMDAALVAGGAVIPADRFGRNVPLSIAVMSILPPGYSSSYDSSVDQNALVNWSGGRPWRDTLDTLMASRGYAAGYAGRRVTIASLGGDSGGTAVSVPDKTDATARLLYTTPSPRDRPKT